MEQEFSFNQAKPDELDFVLLRSSFIDAFAQVEAAVWKILVSCGAAPGNAPFCQRLKDFRKAEKTTLIAKTNLNQRDQIADAVEELLPVRADIVHSSMTTGLLDDQRVAFFTNANEAGGDYPRVRPLSRAQIQEIIRKLQRLKSRIDNLSRCQKPIQNTDSPEALP